MDTHGGWEGGEGDDMKNIPLWTVRVFKCSTW